MSDIEYVSVTKKLKSGQTRAVGWFDAGKARVWSGAISKVASEPSEEMIYTAMGRWVLRRGEGETAEHSFVREDQARTWLLEHGYKDAVRELIDHEIDEENLLPIGRPPIGPRSILRMPVTVYADLDKIAALEGIKRSEVIRRFVVAGIEQYFTTH